MSFEEYYQYYLTLHQNKWTRRFHVLGQGMTVLFSTYIFINWYWYLIPAIPFIVYPFAWFSHYYIEKNKPAAFSRPLWAKACDWVMLKDWILGKVER